LPGGTELPNWNAENCLIQIGDDIYHIDKTGFFKLDTLTWGIPVNAGDDELRQVEELNLPDFLKLNPPGRCAVARVRNNDGILLKNGEKYDRKLFLLEQY